MGKTSIFRTITGNLPVESGTIKLDSVDITQKRIFERARLGIRYVPDSKGVFDSLTVLENLQLACMRTKSSSDTMMGLELFPELRGCLNQRAGTLSGGERKMLSMSMALIGKPELSILDELSEGVAPLMLERLSSALTAIKCEGAMILLAEQNTKFGCESADRIYVIRTGKVVFKSAASEFLKNEAIREHIGIA
jgi:branched-chain amino acid transport system ATP-binding protein